MKYAKRLWLLTGWMLCLPLASLATEGASKAGDNPPPTALLKLEEEDFWKMTLVLSQERSLWQGGGKDEVHLQVEGETGSVTATQMGSIQTKTLTAPEISKLRKLVHGSKPFEGQSWGSGGQTMMVQVGLRSGPGRLIKDYKCIYLVVGGNESFERGPRKELLDALWRLLWIRADGNSVGDGESR